ncbi:uncharacterized protein EDB93DRAFT_1256628 [Suillus bovinus]|uniref:uncharacterized protein n=1 Tax=Suillus bovinus TaxID=48563 RepID=UPI001B885950|nr:uncharacterized protein EDB93DRAFT_1256628 [Suillus bovinus]KAG2128630.1 hypothetical protein EDB93DRAFT_1256628 [Suillus bovinus]
MSEPNISTTPQREFKGHGDRVQAVAVFPDKRRMVTASWDHTLRIWDLKKGVMLKKMEWHSSWISALAVSRDGQLIASGDQNGVVTVWNGETGGQLTGNIENYVRYGTHLNRIFSLDFSPDGKVLATGSSDKTLKLWCTETWEVLQVIHFRSEVDHVRYSPSGELLAIGTSWDTEIYNSSTREYVTKLLSGFAAITWTPDGTRLLSSGTDKAIVEWDTLTWQQVGDPWTTGHTDYIEALAVDPNSTLVASGASDSIRLWRLSDRQPVAIFQQSSASLTFSVDGKHILSGSYYTDNNTLTKWAVDPKDALQEEGATYINEAILLLLIFISLFLSGYPESPVHFLSLHRPISHKDAFPKDHLDNKMPNDILNINMTADDACIAGDLSTAEQLFTREINTDANNYVSYANRSFVMARKCDWDHALQDAIKSINIQPSLVGYISKGIALYGKRHIQDAKIAFDLASIFSRVIRISTRYFQEIAFFNADQHEESIVFVRELAAMCLNPDSLACRVVEVYLHVQLGINAMNDARYNHAANHFTAAVKSDALSSTSTIHPVCKDFVVLFGWDLKSLWQNAHQKRCVALHQAGRLAEALNSYRDMMDKIDRDTRASCLDWSNGKSGKECSKLCLDKGHAALAASNYDSAIDLYSAVINVNSASDAVFASRSKAKLRKMLWDEALVDAQKVIQLNPSSYVGYKLKLAAFEGARRYDDAIVIFRMMFAKLESADNVELQNLRKRYASPSESEGVIRRAIDQQLHTAPLRLLNTATGLLCDREAQISAFKMSAEHNQLWLSWSMKRANLQTEHITEAVATYFRWVMLSHRWEGKEPLLQDIHGKVVYKLNFPGGIAKLRKFCEIARDAGYRWAWSDTCCIDKTSNVELQQSLNSMFVWYQHSALTIVYLSDVLPSIKSGGLEMSEWNRRGWTFQEFLASKIVIFYQKDWTPYLNDHSPNHKKSSAIMEELKVATGIDRQALINFSPGMSGAREKLQWASNRVTTVQEDIAYSLFGVFGVRLPVDYGEKKANAIGRLLQEIVARSGDITALDWVGQSSEFNSCLPADITSYAAAPCTLPSLSETEIQMEVSLLRQNTVAVDLASKLYALLKSMSAPRFANRRLHLPCISFRVAEIRRRRGPAQETHFIYGVKADGLQDLLITTGETLTQFSRAKPSRQTFFLVRPWDRDLLEQLDFIDDEGSVEGLSEPRSQSDGSDELPGSPPVEEEHHLRALRLMVHLGQPFGAFLLAQQRIGEYKRIASDHNIIAQINDIASVDNMNVSSIEIL